MVTVFAYARNNMGSNDMTEPPYVVRFSHFVDKVTISKSITTTTVLTTLSHEAYVSVPQNLYNTACLFNPDNTHSDRATNRASDESFGNYYSRGDMVEGLRNAYRESELYCEIKRQYAWGDGSWLVVEGGPYMESDGKYKHRDLTIRPTTQHSIFDSGTFTNYSHNCYHTVQGLGCTSNNLCKWCTGRD